MGHLGEGSQYFQKCRQLFYNRNLNQNPPQEGQDIFQHFGFPTLLHKAI